MASIQQLPPIKINTNQVKTGAGVVALASILYTIGMIVVGRAFAAALRDFVNAMEKSPGELASETFRRFRAATVGGARAWQNGTAA
jgi:hypothetical protein